MAAQALTQLEHYAEAIDHAEQSLAIAGTHPSRPLSAHCHAGLAKLLERGGRKAEASAHREQAVTLYRQMDMKFWEARLEARV